MSHPLARRLVIAAMLVPFTLSAQGPSAPGATAPATPLLSADAVAKLKPMKWTYAARLMMDGPTTRLGFRSLQLVDTEYQGRPAWLLIDSRQLRAATLAESLYVAKSDLAPRHRVVHAADHDVVADFTADSIVTTFTDSGATKRVAVANESGALANLYMVEALLPVLPLRAGWHASAPIIFVGENDHGRALADVRVTGEESTLVPDGQFDCWVVSLTVGSGEQRLWVRKRDGLVIKSTTPVSGMDGAAVELLLAGGETH